MMFGFVKYTLSALTQHGVNLLVDNVFGESLCGNIFGAFADTVFYGVNNGSFTRSYFTTSNGTDFACEYSAHAYNDHFSIEE